MSRTAPQTAAPKPKVFHTIDGNSLMTQKYEPLQFAIEKILPQVVFVFPAGQTSRL